MFGGLWSERLQPTGRFYVDMHFVVATLLGWLVAVPLIYLIMWIAFPEKPLEAQPVSVTGQGNL